MKTFDTIEPHRDEPLAFRESHSDGPERTYQHLQQIVRVW